LLASNGSYEVFGRGAPIIYINGRLLHDQTELDRIKSEDIVSVELITNPGARYAASVQGGFENQDEEGFRVKVWGQTYVLPTVRAYIPILRNRSAGIIIIENSMLLGRSTLLKGKIKI
jgi:hypothetical protein